MRPDYTGPSGGLDTAANGADRRPCRRRHRPRSAQKPPLPPKR